MVLSSALKLTKLNIRVHLTGEILNYLKLVILEKGNMISLKESLPVYGVAPAPILSRDTQRAWSPN